MPNFNIIELYQRVFGYTGIPVLGRIDTGIILNEDTTDDVTIPNEAQFSDRNSAFGTPLFMPTKLGDLWLPNEPMITISGHNSIVKTYLTGIKGSVKESINTGDYSVRIQAIIVNEESDDLPDDIIRQIRTMCEKRESVEIDNRLLTLFDIHQVAIEDFNFPGIEGYQNCQAYELQCISDWPLELVLKDKK